MVENKSSKQMIDQFRLLKQIGQGGQGDAYFAIDTESEKKVCVKILRETCADSEKDFKDEVTIYS